MRLIDVIKLAASTGIGLPEQRTIIIANVTFDRSTSSALAELMIRDESLYIDYFFKHFDTHVTTEEVDSINRQIENLGFEEYMFTLADELYEKRGELQ